MTITIVIFYFFVALTLVTVLFLKIVFSLSRVRTFSSGSRSELWVFFFSLKIVIALSIVIPGISHVARGLWLGCWWPLWSCFSSAGVRSMPRDCSSCGSHFMGPGTTNWWTSTMFSSSHQVCCSLFPGQDIYRSYPLQEYSTTSTVPSTHSSTVSCPRGNQ